MAVGLCFAGAVFPNFPSAFLILIEANFRAEGVLHSTTFLRTNQLSPDEPAIVMDATAINLEGSDTTGNPGKGIDEMAIRAKPIFDGLRRDYCES